METPSRTFRRLLGGTDLVVAPGAYDGLTARLVEQAGFPLVYMTGAGASAVHGYPDYGLLTLTEMATQAGVLARSVGVPVLADADTGYGNELNVTRTVHEFESRGVAGIHLEDQVSPKRCGHLDGKEVVPRDVFVSKVRAAVAARRDSDFVIVARTDALAVHGVDDAVDRANAALEEAGADVAFVEAPPTLEAMATIPRRVRGACLLNLVPGGKTPLPDLRDAASMGYRVVILPGLLLGATVMACDMALAAVKDQHRVPGSADGSVRERFRRLGADAWDALRRRYADDAGTAR